MKKNELEISMKLNKVLLIMLLGLSAVSVYAEGNCPLNCSRGNCPEELNSDSTIAPVVDAVEDSEER
tara:strand:- start:970 stop:1170 length:201 start_codon:yes stop_codon:yes gene_type:complete